MSPPPRGIFAGLLTRSASIETAGEIKDVYPSKGVTILQGDRLLLNDVYPDKFRRDIQRRLERRGVEIILNDAVSGNPSTEKPIKTREGKELTCDLLVSSFCLLPSAV
jgi:NADH dehydrogenase FAD-containing subunit